MKRFIGVASLLSFSLFLSANPLMANPPLATESIKSVSVIGETDIQNLDSYNAFADQYAADKTLHDSMAALYNIPGLPLSWGSSFENAKDMTQAQGAIAKLENTAQTQIKALDTMDAFLKLHNVKGLAWRYEDKDSAGGMNISPVSSAKYRELLSYYIDVLIPKLKAQKKLEDVNGELTAMHEETLAKVKAFTDEWTGKNDQDAEAAKEEAFRQGLLEILAGHHKAQN